MFWQVGERRGEFVRLVFAAVLSQVIVWKDGVDQRCEGNSYVPELLIASRGRFLCFGKLLANVPRHPHYGDHRIDARGRG